MADDQNAKSVQFRADRATVHSLNGEIVTREKALANRPRGFMRFKTAAEKTWESELKTLIPARDAAQARAEETTKWWTEKGLPIYRKKESDRSAQVDKRVAELENEVEQWAQCRESILPLIKAQREKERALKPKQKVRERDSDKSQGR